MKLLLPVLGFLSLAALAAESKKCKEYSEEDIEIAFEQVYTKNKNDLDKVEQKAQEQAGPGKKPKKSKEDRKNAFKKQMKEIIKANRRAEKTFCQKPNKFTFMDEDEFNSGYLGRMPGEGNYTADFVGTPKEKKEKDKQQKDKNDKKDKNNRRKRQTTLPEFVSYKSFAGPVNNQHGCGNCWAFGGSHTVSVTLAVLKAEYPTDYSEQQLTDCVTAAYGCGGGYAQNVFNYLRDYEFETETQYPYTAAQGTCQMTLGGGNRPILSWSRSHNFGYPDPQKMKEVVAEQPMVTGMWVDPDFKAYGGGVYQPASADCSSGWRLNHEITVIGYGTDPEAGDYWLVKNSWGADWGENGFAKIKRGQNVCNFEIDGRYVTPKDTYEPNTTPEPPITTTADPSHCADLDAACGDWEIYCDTNQYVIDNCDRTCGRCSGTTPPPGPSQCVNEERQCAYYGSADCINTSYDGDKQTTEDGTACTQQDYGEHEWPKPCTNPDNDQAPWCYRAGSPNWDYCFPPC